MFRGMLASCVCIKSYQIVSHLDQAIGFNKSAIIMFLRNESYKLFPLHGNGHLHFLCIARVYNIYNNIFFLSLYLR